MKKKEKAIRKKWFHKKTVEIFLMITLLMLSGTPGVEVNVSNLDLNISIGSP